MLTRTFSKAYGLAGFRVGYAVAPAPLAAALRAVSLPFGVSHVAQAAAIASLEAQAELFVRVEDLVARRADLVARLREVGWDLPDAQGNFVWFPLGDRAARLRRRLRRGGDLVRPFAGDGVRVSASARPRPSTGSSRWPPASPTDRLSLRQRSPADRGSLRLSGRARADNLRESLTTLRVGDAG